MRTDYKKKWTTWFLICVIFIDFIGMATVVVIFPKLLLTSNIIFTESTSDGRRLMWMGVLLALYPFAQIIGAPLFGKLSDYYGRKRLLIITLVGTLFGFAMTSFSIALGLPMLLFISRFVAGFCAGNVAIAQASLLDISNDETRTKNIALSQMAMGSAYIVGPILGALLSESATVSWLSSATPFWLLSLVLGVLILVTIFYYQDTLLQPIKEKIELIGSIKQIYNAMTDVKLRGSFISWLLFVSGWWLFESYMPVFLLQRFHFSTMQIGNVLSFNGALYAGFQYLIVQKVSRLIKPEVMIKYSGFIVALSIMSLAFVNSIFELYVAMTVFVVSMGFMIPGLISYISSQANQSAQGQVMGMVNSIQAVSTVIVMLLGGYLNAFNHEFTIIGGGLLVLVSWLVFLLMLNKKNQSHLYVADTQ